MALLPALQLIVSLLHSLLIPPLLTCLVLTYIPLHIPGILIVFLAAISPPLVAYVSLKWRDFCDQRDAERLGAVLPPRVKDTTFFSTTSLATSMNIMKHGLLGKYLLYPLRYKLSVINYIDLCTLGEHLTR